MDLTPFTYKYLQPIILCSNVPTIDVLYGGFTSGY